jgi:bifunctional oligoribonuclease and PAP phosphatase NrnA
MNYPSESRQIQDAINSASSILLVSHSNPDADAAASLLGFRAACVGQNRSVVMTLGPGTIPETLSFIEGIREFTPVDEVNAEQFDLVVFLDSADEERVGPRGSELLEQALASSKVINIDHHVTNTRFAEINLIDSEAAATCEILFLLLQDLGVTFSPSIATTLLTGIQGDTLGMRTPSTTGRTLEVAADLLRAGADLDTIVDFLFRIRPYSTLKLWAETLSRVEFHGDLIWTEITAEMLERSGADESEAEGIVNFLAGTEGARAAAMLYRKPDGWRISMRSLGNDVDVSRLAALFDGGGHSRAAGCRLSGDEAERQRFLDTIAREIKVSAPSANQS